MTLAMVLCSRPAGAQEIAGSGNVESRGNHRLGRPKVAQVSAGTGLRFGRWIGPNGGFGQGLFATVTPSSGWPSVRGSAFHMRATSTLAGGRTELVLSQLGVRIEVCPVVLRLDPYFVEAGGGVEWARLRAVVSRRIDIVVPALQMLVRTGAVVYDALLLEAQGEVVFPMKEYSFSYVDTRNRQVTIYEIPGVGWAVRLGVGVRFP